QQIRFREWFQWGESRDDLIKLDVTTAREIVLDGMQHVAGTVEITLQNRAYEDSGNLTSQGTLAIGYNEGGLMGDGKLIINPLPNPLANSYGVVQIRDSIPDFTGDIE